MVEATGSLAPMFGVIVAVVVSNLVAVLVGTEGVYESELETQLQVNYLAQVCVRLRSDLWWHVGRSAAEEGSGLGGC